MLAALPKAWHQIIADEDEMLLEIVADRVESLCGFKPGPDMVAKSLKDDVAGRVATPVAQARPTAPLVQRPTPAMAPMVSKAIEQPPYAPASGAVLATRTATPHAQT
jgi:hypothetical protein